MTTTCPDDSSPGHEVILEGGPPDLPRRYLRSGPDPSKITIRRLACNEHFEATERRVRHGAAELPVYRWSYRTAIAE